MRRDFRADPPAQAEAAWSDRAGCRCRHSRGSPGSAAMRNVARVLEPGDAEHAALVGREQLAADAPGPFLLPDEIALPLDAAGELDGLGLIGVELAVRWPRPARLSTWSRCRKLLRRNWTAASCSLVPATPRTVSAPSGLKKLRCCPARFDPRALAGAVAELAGDGVRRRGLEPDGEVDRAAAVRRHDLDVGRRDQAGRDQRAAQIVDLGSLERLAAA